MSRHTPQDEQRSGLTLIELLVATAIGGLLLAAAWPWCWSLTRSSGDSVALADAETAMEFGGRLFQAEVRRATGLVAAGPAPSAASLSLSLPPTDDGGIETVTFRYDSSRGVLWRNGPSVYVIEGLSTCAFTYFAADGGELVPAAGGRLDPETTALVRRVRLSVERRAGDRVVEMSWDASLRGD